MNDYVFSANYLSAALSASGRSSEDLVRFCSAWGIEEESYGGKYLRIDKLEAFREFDAVFCMPLKQKAIHDAQTNGGGLAISGCPMSDLKAIRKSDVSFTHFYANSFSRIPDTANFSISASSLSVHKAAHLRIRLLEGMADRVLAVLKDKLQQTALVRQTGVNRSGKELLISIGPLGPSLEVFWGTLTSTIDTVASYITVMQVCYENAA